MYRNIFGHLLAIVSLVSAFILGILAFRGSGEPFDSHGTWFIVNIAFWFTLYPPIFVYMAIQEFTSGLAKKIEKYLYLLVIIIFSVPLYYEGQYVNSILPIRKYNNTVEAKTQPFINSLNRTLQQDDTIQIETLVGSYALYSRFLNNDAVLNSDFIGSIRRDADNYDVNKLKYVVVSDIEPYNVEEYNTKTTTRSYSPFIKNEISYGEATKVIYRVNSFVYNLETKKCIASNTFYGSRFGKDASDKIDDLSGYMDWLSVLFSNPKIKLYHDSFDIE